MTTREILSEYDVILASASPRRKELMELLSGSFRVIPADCEEKVPEGLAPEETAEYLAKLKCGCIAEVYGHSLVIGSDTVVICDGEVMGKPADEEDARRMLKKLSGVTHQVVTGVCMAYCGRKESFRVSTDVTFRELDDEDIEEYLRTGEPADKAGAYGIQGAGTLLVEKIDGDFFNVVGLPVSELGARLKLFLK